MKKISLLVIALMACIQFANAQRNNGTHVSLSVGINGSAVEDNDGNSTDAVAGLNAGIAVDQYFSRDWSLNLGVNYQQKGYGNGFVTLNNGDEIDNIDFKLNYLTVPILANYHFGRRRNWYVDFGPYVGFLLSASGHVNQFNTDPDLDSNILPDAKGYFNSVDGGIAVNIGVKFPINRQSHFFIEYGGQGGVVNIFNNSYGSFQNITNSLNIGIGF